jgi:hypothetical protein
MPGLRFIGKQNLDVACHVARDQFRADLLRLERRDLLVQRPDLGALDVVQHRRGDRAGDVILREFRGRACVDNGIEVAEIHG